MLSSLLAEGFLLQMTVIFLLQLSTSLWPFLYFTPMKITGVGFPHLILQIIGVSFLLALAMLFPYLPSNFWFSSEVLLFVVPIIFWIFVYFRTSESDDNRRSKFLRPLGGWLLFQLVLKALVPNSLIFSLQSLVLGGAIYAMCLGHYYLVVPKLSNQFLLRVAKLFWFLLIFKLILAVIWYLKFMPDLAWVPLANDYFHLMMVLMGIIWGWLGTIVLAYFGQRLTKMNSIQSATGIYYIVVFFVLTGFLLSNYYFYKYKILF
jgi:hypothetical protein